MSNSLKLKAGDRVTIQWRDVNGTFDAAELVVSTVLIVMLTTALVSYWPSRKIARMSPAEALRGKIQ